MIPRSRNAEAVAKIEALDTTIFSIQPAHYSDRTSFLRVQRLIRLLKPGYAYLEIGFDMGGSLLPHLLDPNCAAAVSIDPRPALQPDERGIDFHYVGNSTAGMLAELGKHVTPAELGKLITFADDASAIDPAQLGLQADLVLIDGEHTNLAAFSDFLAVLPMIAADAIVTFHDANLVGDTIQIIQRFLAQRQTPYSLTILPSCVAVFGFGRFRGPLEAELGSFAEPTAAYFATARRQLHQAVAEAVIGRNTGLRGRSIADLITWVAEAEDRLATPGDRAAAEVLRLQRALDQAEATKAEMRRQIEAYGQSTSWKITAPLRAAASLLTHRRFPVQVPNPIAWSDPTGSDKHYWHRYSQFYRRHFEALGQVSTILEFGVFKGTSIRWLRQMFPNAEIFAVDILPLQPEWPTGAGINYLTADQNDRAGIARLLQGLHRNFDLVIEDGSHIPQHQAACLAVTFPLVRSGGLYILEDLQTSHPQHPFYRENCVPGTPDSLNLLLWVEHLRATGQSLNPDDAERLSAPGLLTPIDVRQLAETIAEVDIYRRTTLPLRCYACGTDNFDVVTLTCRCGTNLDIIGAESMTAALRRTA